MKRKIRYMAALVMALAVATSWAQEGATSPSRQVSDTQWRVKAKEGSWVLACPAGIASDSTTVGEPKDCRLFQNINVKVGDGEQRLLAIALFRLNGSLFVEMVLPFGLDLQAGMGWKIDAKEPMAAKFTTCLPGGCIARIALPDQVLQDLKSGVALQVSFRALGSAQPSAATVDLNGFQKLFDSFS